MKRRLLSSLLCFLLALSSLTSVAFAEKLDNEDVDWRISMTVEQVSSTGAVIVVTQSGGNYAGHLEYGSYYRIEVYRENSWEPVPYIRNDIGWTMEAYILPGNQTTCWAEDWSSLYGELAPGRYRFVKDFGNYCEGSDYIEADFYAEFVIEDQNSTETPNPADDPNPVLDWGVELYADNVSSTGMTLIMRHTGENYKSSMEYDDTCFSIEEFYDGGWHEVSRLVYSACPLESDTVIYHSTFREELNWEWDYGKLEPGHYRFVRDFFDYSVSFQDYQLYAEFIVTEDHTCASKDKDLLCDRCLGLVKHSCADEVGDEECDICGKSISNEKVYRVMGNADWMGIFYRCNIGIMTRMKSGVYQLSADNVSPGDYSFIITENGNYGIWEDWSDKYEFTVTKPTDLKIILDTRGETFKISVKGDSVTNIKVPSGLEQIPVTEDVSLVVPVMILLFCIGSILLLNANKKMKP